LPRQFIGAKLRKEPPDGDGRLLQDVVPLLNDSLDRFDSPPVKLNCHAKAKAGVRDIIRANKIQWMNAQLRHRLQGGDLLNSGGGLIAFGATVEDPEGRSVFPPIANNAKCTGV
jgi:hypothetical protein